MLLTTRTRHSEISLLAISITTVICFLFLKYIVQFIPGIFSNDLLVLTGGSAKKLAFLAATYYYLYLLLQIPAGIIIDKCHMQKTIMLAITCCFIGILIFYLSHTFATLLISRIFMGIGASFATVAYMRTTAIYFNEMWFVRLAGLFGTICMGGAGSILLIFGFLNTRFGLPITTFYMLLFAGFTLVLGGFSWLITLRINVQHHHPKIMNESVPFRYQLLHIIANKNNLLLTLYNGLAFSPITIFGGLWGNHYLTQFYGLNTHQAASALSCLFYGFALGGIIMPSLCKREESQQRMMIIGSLLSAVFFTILVYAPRIIFFSSSLEATLLLSCIGFSTSSFLLSYVFAKKLNPPLLVATTIAIVNMGDPIFSGTAEPLMGYILDFNKANGYFTLHGYQLCFIVLICYWLTASIAINLVNLGREKKSTLTLDSNQVALLSDQHFTNY